MHARQPMHRVLSWIITFGFTVGVLISGSFVMLKQPFPDAQFHHEVFHVLRSPLEDENQQAY
jgi:hypothetical protein